MKEIEAEDWDHFLHQFPDIHILQTSSWGKLKSHFGWQPVHIIDQNSGAQVLFRKLPLNFSVAYIPKGPVGLESDLLWERIHHECKKRNSIFLKVEPDEWEEKESNVDKSQILPANFKITSTDIQPRKTLIINLRQSEDEILAQMKQKTRYNIRLAKRKGVAVRQTDDIHLFYELMCMTGERDRFGIHSYDYYRKAYEIFSPKNECNLFVAEYKSVILATLMVFTNHKRSWYFYGASSDTYREKMPSYLIQWEAIRWSRNQGCYTYDMWGIPDEPDDVLEEEFINNQQGLWGVYRFKRGFGGEPIRTIGSWDYVYSKPGYSIYRVLSRKEQNG